MLHASAVFALTLTALVGAPVEEPGLRWEAPSQCPSQARAEAYLADTLDGVPVQRANSVVVEQTADGWRAELRIGDEPARSLMAASCEDLMAAAMVVIAVAHDAHPASALLVPSPPDEPPDAPPDAPRAEPPDEPPAEPPDEPPVPTEQSPVPGRAEPAASQVRSVPPAEPSRADSKLEHWVGVDAGAAAIHVRAVTMRAGLRYVLRGANGALRVGGHFEVPRLISYPNSEVGGRVSAGTAEAGGCYEPSIGRLRGVLCGVAAAGAVVGRGQGIPTPRRSRRLWLGAQAIAGLRWAWSPRWMLALEGVLSVGLRRPAFHVGDRDPLFRSPRLGGAAMLGVERRLR